MLGVIKVLGSNCCFAANSFYCLRLPIHPMLEGGDPNAGGHRSSAGCCCFAANSFYCLRLPIHPMLEGGDPNAMLGVIKVLGVNSVDFATHGSAEVAARVAFLLQLEQPFLLDESSSTSTPDIRHKSTTISHPIVTFLKNPRSKSTQSFCCGL